MLILVIKTNIPTSLIRYLITGGVAFAADYLLLMFCFYAIGTSIILATTIGFIGGLCISFFTNRYWVHGKGGSSRKQHWQLLEYALLVVVNYIFTVYALRFLYDMGVPLYLGKILTMVLITVWNYVIFSKLIFATNAKRGD